jgi:hypothetical protein
MSVEFEQRINFVNIGIVTAVRTSDGFHKQFSLPWSGFTYALTMRLPAVSILVEKNLKEFAVTREKFTTRTNE